MDGFVNVNGLDMRVRTAGQGPRRVIFVHALGADADLWEDMAQRMPAGIGSVRYDLRGHGETAVTPAPYSLRQLSGDLLALMDALDITRATICGISIGGLIAQQVAIDAPHRVESLILCNTALRIGSAEGWQARMDAVASRGLADMADEITARWYAPSFPVHAPERAADLRRRLAGMSAVGYIGACAALRDGDLRNDSPAIISPTLVVSGSADIAAPSVQGRELAAAIPHAKFADVAGAGHLPCIENPAALAALIESFLMETKVV